jgi:hypothetical protein
MPFHAQCPGCLTSAYLDCQCPPGFDPAQAGLHFPGVCPLANPDAAVVCPDPAATGCCTQAHDHGEAANSCPATHDGPCARELPDCKVCRPLIITAMPGSATLYPVTGG